MSVITTVVLWMVGVPTMVFVAFRYVYVSGKAKDK